MKTILKSVCILMSLIFLFTSMLFLYDVIIKFKELTHVTFAIKTSIIVLFMLNSGDFYQLYKKQ